MSRRHLALFAIVAVVACIGLAVSRPTGYPGEWPRPAGSWFSRHGDCPDVAGDYDEVPPEILQYFGVGSTRDRWSHHHARLVQADDGSWLRIELGLNSTGMRVALGDVPGERMQGLGRGTTLRKGEHYTCSGGWIHSIARAGSEGDSLRHEDLRMAKDAGGGLIVGETNSMEGSIGWGDSPRISTGRGNQNRWYRWAPRGATDDAFVASLQAVTLARAPWINNGRSVPTFFSNKHLMPICARLVREWRVNGMDRVVVRANTQSSAADPTVLPAQCPEDSGRMGAMTTTIWQVDIPDGDTALGPPRIEWQRIDALDRPWNRIEIDDVRMLRNADI